MELNAIHRHFFVFQRHNLSCFIGSENLQTVRHAFRIHHKGMVSCRINFLFQSVKQRICILNKDFAHLSVHQFLCRYDFSAEHFPDGLMSKTNTKNRHSAGELPDHFVCDSRGFRISRPRRNDNRLRRHGFYFFYCNLIVSCYFNMRMKFSHILVYVIGKRIIIINQ